MWPFNVSVPLFRSEDMSYVSVTVTNDAAYETLMEIGKFGRFHFVDVSRAAAHTHSLAHSLPLTRTHSRSHSQPMDGLTRACLSPVLLVCVS